MDLMTVAIYTIGADLLIPIGHQKHYKLYTLECNFQALLHDAGVQLFLRIALVCKAHRKYATL